MAFRITILLVAEGEVAIFAPAEVRDVLVSALAVILICEARFISLQVSGGSTVLRFSVDAATAEEAAAMEARARAALGTPELAAAFLAQALAQFGQDPLAVSDTSIQATRADGVAVTFVDGVAIALSASPPSSPSSDLDMRNVSLTTSNSGGRVGGLAIALIIAAVLLLLLGVGGISWRSFRRARRLPAKVDEASADAIVWPEIASADVDEGWPDLADETANEMGRRTLSQETTLPVPSALPAPGARFSSSKLEDTATDDEQATQHRPSSAPQAATLPVPSQLPAPWLSWRSLKNVRPPIGAEATASDAGSAAAAHCPPPRRFRRRKDGQPRGDAKSGGGTPSKDSAVPELRLLGERTGSWKKLLSVPTFSSLCSARKDSQKKLPTAVRPPPPTQEALYEADAPDCQKQRRSTSEHAAASPLAACAANLERRLSCVQGSEEGEEGEPSTPRTSTYDLRPSFCDLWAAPGTLAEDDLRASRASMRGQRVDSTRHSAAEDLWVAPGADTHGELMLLGPSLACPPAPGLGPSLACPPTAQSPAARASRLSSSASPFSVDPDEDPDSAIEELLSSLTSGDWKSAVRLSSCASETAGSSSSLLSEQVEGSRSSLAGRASTTFDMLATTSQGGATGRDATAVSDEGVRSRRSFAPCNFRLPSRFSMTRTSSANTSQNRLSAAQSSDPTTTSNETETSWSSLPGLQSTQTPAVAAPALLTRASTTAGSDIGDDPPPTVTRIADRVRQWEQGETTQRYFI